MRDLLETKDKYVHHPSDLLISTLRLVTSTIIMIITINNHDQHDHRYMEDILHRPPDLLVSPEACHKPPSFCSARSPCTGPAEHLRVECFDKILILIQ